MIKKNSIVKVNNKQFKNYIKRLEVKQYNITNAKNLN